jgi:A/G-specific adenine glycosylase
MDLGATVCTPRDPACPHCPLQAHCQAFTLGIQAELPVSPPRPPVPHFIVTAGIIQREEKVLVARRPTNGLLGGLWEFPGGKVQEGESLPACLQRELSEELGVDVEVGDPAGVYRHAYTHFQVTLHAFYCRLTRGEPRPLASPEIRWLDPLDLVALPMGKIDRQIAQLLISQKP